MTRLAIIAGQGRLPAEIAQESAEPPLVCALEGAAPAGLGVDRRFRFERLSPFLRALADDGVGAVVLAGAMQRPALDPALFDPATASLMPQLLPAMQQGDDALLRAIIAVIEDHGLAVLGLAEVAPGLLAGEGVMGMRAPDKGEQADAARGVALLDMLAPADIGQGCVVAAGLCLGIETLYGTDAMLAFVAGNRQARHPQMGGVFVKRAKTGQERRVDLPAIGPETVAAAQAAALSGIAVQAGQVVVLERSETVERADAAGIALWSVP
ncbi:MAG: UDP-2,3-diacylglucosamine diphosphatase LpxI [Pararhodobacter sp.]|nr:UDP-2,3-diacylglucosamine diphosphatase LpxI [Pararhodobacter sp.]